MDGVIGGIILYKVGGRGFGQWNGLKPLPSLLITKVIFSTFWKWNNFMEK